VGKAKVKDASANTKAKAKDEKRKKCPSCEMKKKRTYAYEADGIRWHLKQWAAAAAPVCPLYIIHYPAKSPIRVP